LCEGLSGFVIPTIKAHRVVDGEPGVTPAQEGLGELLRDEAQLQEEADGTPTQALGQASGIMDGKEVELPGGVESAFEDEGVEVRVEPKRVSEGLISDHSGGGDGLASCGGIELGDQRENEYREFGEQALIMAEEDPQSLGQGEDELSMGQGKQQVLVEVLGKQEGPFLAA
jgi:hypothetical protein